MAVTWQAIADGIHGLNCDGFVWVYALVKGDRAALIDTGLATHGSPILEALVGIGVQARQVETIVVTHCHQDHAGSLAMLLDVTGARSIAHRLDAPCVRGEAVPPEPALTEAEKPLFDAISKNVVPAPPARVDVEVEDGDEVDLMERATVVHVPGHTPGSIAIYLPGQRTLFCGDAIANVNGPALGFFNVDRAGAIASLRRLSDLEFEIAGFGHGAPLLADGSTALRRAASKIRA